MDVKEIHVSVKERTPISAEQVDLIAGLFRQGLARAASSLSEMVGHKITALDGRIEVLPLAQAQALVDGLLATAIDASSEVLVGVTSFAQMDAEPRVSVRGTFLFVPEPDGLATLLRALEQPV